jgi:hypothetical protein
MDKDKHQTSSTDRQTCSPGPPLRKQRQVGQGLTGLGISSDSQILKFDVLNDCNWVIGDCLNFGRPALPTAGRDLAAEI